MQFGSIDSGDDDEHNNVAFVGISSIIFDNMCLFSLYPLTECDAAISMNI